MKKAVFYDPYLDTLGGGERYCLSFAQDLLKKNWQIDFLWPKPEIATKIKQRFGIEGEDFNYIEATGNILQKRFFTSQYDLCFWISDGSLPWLHSKKNLLHFQVPFINVNGSSLLNRLKFKKINKVICNSKFTQKIIQKEFKVKGEVVYPPIDVDNFLAGNKENVILYVGRFSQLLQSKRQDILIKAFQNMCDSGLSDYILVLAGSADIGGEEYYQELANLIGRYPISLVKNPNFSEIKSLYSKAQIFWSASGFGIDENIFPQKVEHFGMTVVEAMAAGAIPLAYNGGGHREIIENGIDGYLWKSEDELISLTKSIVKNRRIHDKIFKATQVKAKMFSEKHFLEQINQLIC